ncbi:helix-turn-helix domain-containing protein [Dyadobacter frigoris]|uniref:Helix-turn-helix domain-containing protein n=1 Tax=Dyadobacter frigoris TaxID=2576211 RepID=A0A4U6D0G8_9BACT|nr:AraC family transcriptional regulator [Dyadobacter frigoris]TKT90572.1 helix-turn-helix domain-containing protein [Dyadobacter frigoris]GLU51285.1 AraC family transcriptional regulator [Dyadobacter frigoris]
MEKPDIPRFALESFARVNYKVPFLKVQHYPLDANYFSIENRENYPVVDYISPNRRQFFKIFHMTAGTGVLTVGLHQYTLGPGDIAFLHPDEIMSWQTTSEETGGHFCLIHPKYFERDADHILQSLRMYPYFKASKAVIQLSANQSAMVNQHFKSIVEEEKSTNDDKKQAILLHLQMILLEAQRAGKILADAAVPESYGYIHGFLSLLESSFQVHGQDVSVKLKTAAEFAGQLHVHPNYLNSLVKEHTGKTLREHIQERLMYEAKTLLLQTDWDISNISNGLGFSGHAAFTSFFKKKEHISPSIFRKSVLSQVNS